MLKDNTQESKFKGDAVIWAVFLFLCLISVIEVFSASSNLSFKTGNYLGPVLKHCALLAVGVVVMICTMNIKCRYFKIVTPFALLLSFILLIVVFFVGESTNGSQRWIDFLGIQFQPSELAKGAIILATAQILSAMQTPAGTDRRAFKYIIIVCLMIIPLIMVENLSTAVLLATVVFLMMFIGKVPGQQLGRLLGLVTVALALVVTMVMVFGHDEQKEGSAMANQAMVEQTSPKDENMVEKVFHRFDTWKARIDNFLSSEYVAPEDVDINGRDAQTSHANRHHRGRAGHSGRGVRLHALHRAALPHGYHRQPLRQHIPGPAHHGLRHAAGGAGAVQHGRGRGPGARNGAAAATHQQGRNVNHHQLRVHRRDTERKPFGKEKRRCRGGYSSRLTRRTQHAGSQQDTQAAAKGRLSRCERRPFALPFAAFCTAKGAHPQFRCIGIRCNGASKRSNYA